MKLLTRIAVLFYVTMALFLSAFILLFVLNYIDIRSVQDLLWLIYYDEKLRFIFAVAGGVILFLNYIFYQSFSVNVHKGKTIAFDNPSGRVSVSLAAIEEMTKRVISKVGEVREVKSKITASKRGLHIKVTLILRSEGSIPEVTSQVQEMVKARVQDAIGLDEPIEIAIFVGKILPDQIKEKRPEKKKEPPKGSEPNVPFQGYRA